LEFGVEIDDAIIPVQLAPVDSDRHRRGKKRLGHRCDLKKGLRVDRAPALAAEAKAFGVDQLVAGDEADGKAGDIEAIHVGRDIVLEAWDERPDLLLDRVFGKSRFGSGSGLRRDGEYDDGCDKRCGRGQ
jgi:hypothetical protein